MSHELRKGIRFALIVIFGAAALFLFGCEQRDTLFDVDSSDSKRTPEMTLDVQPPGEDIALSKAGDSRLLPGRYIVVFNQDVSNPRARAEDLLSGHDGTLMHVYSHALSGFSARMSDKAADAIAAAPSVAFVEPDREMFALDEQTNAAWGLDRIDQRDLPLSETYVYDADGTGVTAYVIDTGIRTSHSEFGGRAIVGFDAIGDGRNGQDCHGHGTHVAGIVGGATYGVAKNAGLVAVRVLNCSGSGTTSGVVAGIDWVAQNANHPAVANMSLGGGASTALDTAVRNSISAGVTYVIAAGNSDADASFYSPARVDEAITVGATTSADSRSSFSNYGSQLDVFAPGSGITSAWHTSDTANNVMSGTSMATPHVAGTAALFLQSNSSASPADVANAVTTSATYGRLSDVGSGSPNLLVYSILEQDDTAPPPPPPPPDDSPCPSCEVYEGTLIFPGLSEFQPNGTYYHSGKGTHNGYLRGPETADFDLYLYKWRGFGWREVASSLSLDSNEEISYTGNSGYYTWMIYAYSGSGDYTFYLDRP